MGVLSGRAGVVTGAGRGIGRAIALELGRNGVNVAIGYSQSREAAEEVAAAIQAAGVEAFPLQANVSRPEEVKVAIASVAERFGRIDFLVDIAGIARDRTLVKMARNDWEAVVDVHLHSIFNVADEVLPY